jgi:hypothetical protein
MPVSKKRKKDGKPVHRARPAAEGEAPAGGPAPAEPGAPVRHAGKPANPFVAMQQARRGAQRGR